MEAIAALTYVPLISILLSVFLLILFIRLCIHVSKIKRLLTRQDNYNKLAYHNSIKENNSNEWKCPNCGFSGNSVESFECRSCTYSVE